MLMAHSVEGRFPFLDKDVITLANRLPATYKLHVLDEKHVLKRASRDLVPDAILVRKKQPYRAPDALSFVASDRPAWIDEMFSESSVGAAGIFDPTAIARLWSNCRAKAVGGQFSNADNMAVVGVLSTQLLHRAMIAQRPTWRDVSLRTIIDRVDGVGSGPR
jgi:asparagine synthase (glutamine-hydrolysing)